VVVTFYAIPKVIGIGHVYLRLHITFVRCFHVPLEGFLRTFPHTFAVIVALTDVKASIDIIQLRCLHVPLERQFKADLHASATLIADTEVVHRLGVARISLFAVIVSLVSLFWHRSDLLLSIQIFPKPDGIVMMAQLFNDVYKLLLYGFLSCSHLLGKILNRPLFASHAESLAKQQVFILSERIIQQTVNLLRQLEPWCTSQVKRVVSIGNPVQTAVILPSVLHLHQQILFVVKLAYVHHLTLYLQISINHLTQLFQINELRGKLLKN